MCHAVQRHVAFILCGRHDTVEDTNTTLHDISTEFGNHVAAIVAEVTDDKSLSKQRRKELQISHAATCSREAKLVKMADKLYNLMDLQRELPRGWSVPRAQAYVGWSREVIEGCRGICQPLEAALDRVFDGTFVVDGQEVRCVPDQYVPGDWRKDTPVTD